MKLKKIDINEMNKKLGNDINRTEKVYIAKNTDANTDVNIVLYDEMVEDGYLNDVSIIGNKNYFGHMSEIVERIYDNINDITDSREDNIKDGKSIMDKTLDVSDDEKALMKVLFDDEERFKDVSDSEFKKLSSDIYGIAVKWSGDMKNFYECELLSDVLTIITGKKYDCKTICGCSQSEWQYIVYPKERENDIPYIEAVYFGTGTEYLYSEPTTEYIYDFKEYLYKPDSIILSLYTEKYDEKEIISKIAEESGVKGEDVIVLEL